MSRKEARITHERTHHRIVRCLTQHDAQGICGYVMSCCRPGPGRKARPGPDTKHRWYGPTKGASRRAFRNRNRCLAKYRGCGCKRYHAEREQREARERTDSFVCGLKGEE